MRYATLITSLLATAAVSIPALAWAAPDCGNPPVKSAEVVYNCLLYTSDAADE